MKYLVTIRATVTDAVVLVAAQNEQEARQKAERGDFMFSPDTAGAEFSEITASSVEES